MVNECTISIRVGVSRLRPNRPNLRTGNALLGIVHALLFATACGGCEVANAVEPPGDAKPSVVCQSGACLVAGNGAFPSLVVGEVVRIEAAGPAQAWWSLVRKTGAWSALSGDAIEFGQLVRPVVIRTVDHQSSGPQASGPHERLLTVLMTQYEYDGTAMPEGTLVRYSPHGIDHERPPVEVPRLQSYWGITGCVLMLCLAQDAHCKGRYLPGIYERSSGRAADWRTGRATTDQALIDPVTRLPLRKTTPETQAGGS